MDCNIQGSHSNSADMAMQACPFAKYDWFERASRSLPQGSIQCGRADSGRWQEAFGQRSSHHARLVHIELLALDQVDVVDLGGDVLQAHLVDCVMPVLGTHFVRICNNARKGCGCLVCDEC